MKKSDKYIIIPAEDEDESLYDEHYEVLQDNLAQRIDEDTADTVSPIIMECTEETIINYIMELDNNSLIYLLKKSILEDDDRIDDILNSDIDQMSEDELAVYQIILALYNHNLFKVKMLLPR